MGIEAHVVPSVGVEVRASPNSFFDEHPRDVGAWWFNPSLVCAQPAPLRMTRDGGDRLDLAQRQGLDPLSQRVARRSGRDDEQVVESKVTDGVVH